MAFVAPAPKDEKRKQGLGDELEQFLDALQDAGLGIGPRERLRASWLAASLMTDTGARQLKDLKYMLAPLLTRSNEEHRRFFQIYDQFVPADPQRQKKRETPAPTMLERLQEKEVPLWRKNLAFLATGLVLLIGSSLAMWALYTPSEQDIVTDKPDIPINDDPPVANAKKPQIDVKKAPRSKFPALNRVAKAAERFEDAPSLRELGRMFSANSKIGWSANAYTVRLSELTGLPADRPLALYGQNGRQGRIWARVAQGLDRIERPGREGTLRDLNTAADLALKDTPPANVYLTASVINLLLDTPVARKPALDPDTRVLLTAVETDPPIKIADASLQEIDTRVTTTFKKAFVDTNNRIEIDTLTLQRALAISQVPDIPPHFFDGAPWLPQHPPAQASTAPPFARWLAFFLPLLLAAFLLSRSQALRQAWLRRRPPEHPPERFEITSDARTTLATSAGKFRHIARKLLTRTPRPTGRLDIARTIGATLGGGGMLIEPVYARDRHAPDYLILIERQRAGDQDAKRLHNLVMRFDAMLALTIYFYQSEPSLLEPEGGGRSVPIEVLQASYPHHRLIVLGSGARFLDPVHLRPRASAVALMHWERRALLTPLPLAEWSQNEYRLARELQLPIGRASLDGLAILADLLGLEGSSDRPLHKFEGDNLARPLPASLRSNPAKFLYRRPPYDLPVEDIIDDLRNYLDGPGFEWLCALAIYPAVQWDLTLYLGTTLLQQKEEDDPEAKPERFYSESRIAALTQLPWLRENQMPNWLRRALINELPSDRAQNIRKVINKLLEGEHKPLDSEDSGEQDDDKITLSLARESTAPNPYNKPFDDEVLIDFLSGGKAEDFALSEQNWLTRYLPRGLLRHIGLPELSAGLLALVYALAAFFLTPAPDDGALVTGAFLPLALLAVGALVTLALLHPRGAYSFVRTALIRVMPLALAWIFLLVLMALLDLSAAVLSGNVLPLWSHIFTAIAALFGARRFSGLHAENARPAMLTFLLQAAVLWLLVALATQFIPELALFSPLVGAALATLGLADLMSTEILISSGLTVTVELVVSAGLLLGGLGLLVFLAGWLARRWLPETLPETRKKETEPLWLGDLVRSLAALLPILPAIMLSGQIASSSQALPDIPGGISTSAQSADGKLFALGGEDGRVRVFSREGRRARLLRTLPDKEVTTGRVTAIAVQPYVKDPTKIALVFSNEAGQLLLFEASSGDKIPLADNSFPKFSTPPQLALLPVSPVPDNVATGLFMTAAFESENGGTSLWISGARVASISNGPVTAIKHAGPGLAAFTTFDGRTNLLMAKDADPPRLITTDAKAPRLPGRARFLEVDQKAGTVTAIGDDGSTLSAVISNNRLANIKPGPKLAHLGLGPAVPWRAQTDPQKPPAAEPKFNEAKFFACIRKSLHRRGMSDIQFQSYRAILAYWDSQPALTDKRWLAYIFATALHESNMRPVRDGFARSDAGARKFVARMARNRTIGRNYAKADPVTGHSYYGRGFVQLTHAENYKKIGRKIGMGDRLYRNPDLALQPVIAAKILVVGMITGFQKSRQHKLVTYFNKKRTDWKNARRIINNDVRKNGNRVGNQGKAYLKCLNGAALTRTLFTAAQVRKISPNARKDIVDALVENQQYFYDAKITTPLRLTHFFTQIALETGGLRRLDENMNYSEKTLLRVFSRATVSTEKAAEIANKPRLIANWVYGARLGNKGRNTDDGWNYRGSSMFQLTGRVNFRRIGRTLNLPLEEQPELARQPKTGLLMATSYWTAKKINRVADRDDLRQVRKLINGGTSGYAQSKLWYRKARKVFFPASETNTANEQPETEEVKPVIPEPTKSVNVANTGELDRKLFFRCARSVHRRMTQQQVDGYNTIFAVWLARGYKDLRWLAYSLGTAYHETANKMTPVREGLCKDDACARRFVANLFRRGITKLDYGKADTVTGESYYGRGFLQITWAENYKKAGQKLGMGDELYKNPDLALEPQTSAKILLDGLVKGWFRYSRKNNRNERLDDYLNDRTTDWVGARNVAFVKDGKGERVAAHARKYFKCLKWVREPVAIPVSP